MKKLIFLFLLIVLSCNKDNILKNKTNIKFMPSPVVGAVVRDDPRNIENVGITISSEMRAKGKSAMKSPTGVTPTDSQISGAIIASATSYPSAFVLPTPPISNQGSEGSCVAFAVGYYSRSIAQYTWTGASSFSNSVNVFSPEWLYDQTKASTSCGSGSSVINALNFIVNNGDCLYATVPYSDQDGCTLSVTPQQQAEAANYKIGSYGYVIATDISAIKSVLYSGRALTVTIPPDNLFYNADANFIWNGGGTIYYAPHCITVVGWDDSKNAVKVANQWGTTWGDNGFSWIDYNFLGTITYDMYYMNPIVSNTAPVANAGFDQVISLGAAATLDGSASKDPDGYIAAYAWTKISGPSSPTIVNSTSPIASITPTAAGTYIYQLQVTDNSAATATDSVTITVNSSVTESLALSLSKASYKGKISDTIKWTIVLNTPPQLAEIQYSLSYSTLYTISPYTPTGQYTTLNSTKNTRYYRLKVVKSDGTIAYSQVYSIK